MATYNRITPATLANLAPVIDDPADTEAANKLAQVDLQTRRFVNDFLITKFDATTGKVLPAAIDPATSLAELVSGSTSNVGTARQIVQGTVSTPDLRDLAVSTAKLAADCVLGTKIADAQVNTEHLVDLAVTAAKIAANTITAAKMANDSVDATVLKDDASGAAGAVTADHIRTSAVTTAKILDNAVTGIKMVAGSAEGQLLVAGASPFTFAPTTMSGAGTLSAAGVLTLTTANQCEIVERANNGVVAGVSTATTWHIRGAATNWIEAWKVPTSSFVTIDASGAFSLPVGTYILEACAPAYKTDEHITRLVRYNVSDVVQETFYGSSEDAPAAASIQSRSVCRAKITIAAVDDYVQLEHYGTTANATDGLGHPASAGGTYEIYAKIRIEQVA